MRATIVVPSTTPQSKRARLKGARVELLTTDGGYDEAETVARDIARRERVIFLSPYAGRDVALGNGASVANEITNKLGRCPETIITPIGGGGLASGIAWGLAELAGANDRRRRVWVVQSEASAAFALSCRDGAAWERLDSTTPTLAEGLEGGIEQAAFTRAAKLVRGVSVVSERAIAQGIEWLDQTQHLRVEGSAAVVIALAIQGLPQQIESGDVVFVLTGRNID
jgi:threonine dehydratase